MSEERPRSTCAEAHNVPNISDSATKTPVPHLVRRVLVCLDRSALSEACLPYAGFMARVLGADLTLLHVMPSPNEVEAGAFDVLGWEISRREAEQYLAHLQAELTARGVPPMRIHIELAQGQPASRVLSLERESHADLLVLSRHGEGGRAVWSLGATAQRVLMNATGSLLIVPTEGLAQVVPPQRILVPLDGSSRAESVLPLVLEAATAQQAEVILVHVVTEPRPSGVFNDAGDLRLARTLATHLERGAEAYLAGVRERLLHVLPRVKVQVLRRSDTREAVLGAARDESVDLLVLSAHGATCNAAHPFGSVTAHALAYAALPLLVVQDLPSDRPRSERPSLPDGSLEAGRGSLSSRPVKN